MRNVKRDKPRQSFTTPLKQKEKRMEIVLHCTAREFCLHQGINKQTKK